MKNWIVRFVSLLVFNAAVLLLIGFLTPARVGWSALWAALVMTALVLFVKPVVHRWFASASEKSRAQRTRAGEWLVQVALVLVVAWIVWVLTVLLTGIRAPGILWAWILPPIIIAIGWLVYAKIDDVIEAKAGEVYDRVEGSLGRTRSDAAAAASDPAPTAATQIGRAELHDGLTAEQRKMLDEL